MGTRSLTRFVENGDVVCVLYRQFDGYPSGHGKDLSKFLRDFYIVNGYTQDDQKKKCANGIGCLAAQVISFFKEGIGNFYMVPPDVNDCGQDYEYTIYNKKGCKSVFVDIEDCSGELLFSGRAKEALTWCNKQK